MWFIFIFVAKWAIWKFRKDIKYNNNEFDTIQIKEILKIELKINYKISPFKKNIWKLLFENLQTKLA